ncbi:receptor-type tyrosine-protein phosphatase C isoform X1 [Hydra vulgaris]|uniref:receptor-type tyrosine-protein phosphatase C isoform X1 n=1 Tax=Hydra vulgaris TaxID=6087 RepID=UPI0006414AD3|nr:receptor-type tyrosine-protein phosphatase C [Hydra vulgaris]
MEVFVLMSTLLVFFPSSTCLCSIPLSSVVTANLQSATSIKDVYFNIANVIQTNKVFCAKVGKDFSIQFDFSNIKTITRLDIKGFELNKTMMMLHSFTLHFSIDKKNWFDYSVESDKVKVFDVAWLFMSSETEVIEHILPKPAIGRYMQLRSVPDSHYDLSNICLNVAVYGCNEVMRPTVVVQKEIKAYLKKPTQLSCQSEGMMNYSLTLSFFNQKQTVYLNSSRTQLYQQLSVSKNTFVQVPHLLEYTCVTTNRLLQCKKTMTCSAEQLFSSHQKVVSESVVMVQAELPEQLKSFKVVQKTTTTVLLGWTLPDLKDITKKHLQLKLNCSMMSSAVLIDELNGSFELTNLSPYQFCWCTLELKLKYNTSINLNQKPLALEFRSRSERPNIVPKIYVVHNGSRKIRLKVEAKFDNPNFGKLIGCYIYVTQLHGKQFQSAIQTTNLTFPLSVFNSILIRDLLPWTYYNISVLVFNDDNLLSNISYLQQRTSQSRPDGAPTIEATTRTATTISGYVKHDNRYPDKDVITSYEIVYNPGNHTFKINIDENLGEQQFFHIQDLKPFTWYQICSRSKNKAGYGPFSDFIWAMTEEHTPNEPTDILYEKKNQNLILTWKPPSTPNGNITKYEIQITLRNRTVVTIFTLKFIDFDTNISYNSVLAVAIRAYTSKGYGQFSLVIQVYQFSVEPGSSEYGQNSRILIVAFCITLLLLVALGICGFNFYKRCHSQPQQSFSKSSLFVHYVPSKVDEKEELLFQEKSKLPTESLSDPVKSHDPVPVESFAQYINRAEQNNYEILASEFKNETMSGKCYPWEVADRPENRPKNRYGDIAAYDHSRVILKFDCKRKQSDYINASYIQGCNCKSDYKYISSQGPMENGLNDFWHMIYQENIKIIVMLTNLIENEKEKCCQYWPDEGTIKYSSVSVTLVKIDKTADYVIRLFHIQKIGGESENIRLVRQFHFVSWPDHGVPDYPTALLSLRRRVRRYYTDDSPMLVHCSAGVGRSGCFILIDNMLDRIDDERTVDIFNYLQHLRSRRTNMVQTLEQYIFAHMAILEYIEFGNTEITLDDLDKKTKELMNGTGMADEFSVLCQSTQSDMQGSNLYKVLLSEGKYIDASFVDGYKQRNSFILTLAPKEDSAYEFWKMVVEQQCHTIVMLAKCQEGVEGYYRYWPDVDGECSYRDLNVFLCSEVANGNIITRKIKIVSRKLRCEVNHFQYVDWPNGDVPHRRAYPNICTLMQSAEKSQQQLGNGPIIVHAGNDYGRSGTFVAIYNSTERLKVEQLIDVLQCVRTIRIAQPLAVDNVLQYQFVYQLLRIYLEGFENYWNYKDYKVCKSPKNSVSTC